ncbi:MAG TPA: CobD/CbiB family protein [Casimicrobiaceae bacterium]|jgi:cobalamin biosynthesis protein CobD/CbiB
MNFVAILAALGLEQWRPCPWRPALERAFRSYAAALEHRFNGGTVGQGTAATLLALLPWVLLAGLAWAAAARVHPALGFVVNVVALYSLMGFRRFSHAVSAIIAALRTGDLTAARRTLAGWRGGWTADLSSQDVARLTIERGVVDAYREVFAVLFWFLVLPGPAGAVLYRLAALLVEEWRTEVPHGDVTPLARDRGEFGRPARTLLWLLDWVPVRLTALSFAVVGDFEDAVYCWRTQPAQWPLVEGGEPVGILLASAGGALGVELGGPIATMSGEPEERPAMGMGDTADTDLLPSAVGLVWRALVLWLLLTLLLTLANWAP